MPNITLVIGNRNYSSWSLRGWLAVKLSGTKFEEVMVPLDRPETRECIRAHSPTGLVPILKCGDEIVWDSLSITEWLAERFPQAPIWPADGAARAYARSICAEMHSGFSNLRGELPMNIRRKVEGHGINPETKADIARICEIWKSCRKRYGNGGPFLFGAPCAADAFFAPVVSRFRTYGVETEGSCQAYSEAVWNWPIFREWIEAAGNEPFTVEKYEDVSK